jgi:hypothetical protein
LSVKIEGLGKVIVYQIFPPDQEVSTHFKMPKDCNYLPFYVDKQKGCFFTKPGFSQAAFADPSDPSIAHQMILNDLLLPSLLDIAKKLVLMGRVSG